MKKLIISVIVGVIAYTLGVLLFNQTIEFLAGKPIQNMTSDPQIVLSLLCVVVGGVSGVGIGVGFYKHLKI